MNIQRLLKKNGISLQLVAITALSVVASFAIGIKSSNNLRTIASLEAVSGRLTGDIDGDDAVTLHDVIEVLEIVRGYKEPTTSQLKTDPNGDGQLTIDDALRLLHDLQLSNTR